MGSELYPPNPTHDEFYKKLFEFEENYTEVEETEFIFTSEELEKLEAQVKEVKKAKNTFENSTVGSRHVKYADVYLHSVQIGFMMEKLRRIHEGNDFTDLDIKIKELASQLVDWFREQFVWKQVQTFPRNSSKTYKEEKFHGGSRNHEEFSRKIGQ